MSEPKYTKGPWVVRVEGLRKQELIVRSTVMVSDELDGGEYEPLIADLYRGGTGNEADANLIAAAPEQHEALQAYEEAFERLFAQCLSNGLFDAWGRPVDCTLLNEAYQKGERAIKKALGTP